MKNEHVHPIFKDILNTLIKEPIVGYTVKEPTACYTVMSTVPYQLCPKCNGDGKILIQDRNGSNTDTSNGLQTCNLCKGAMVIPMHIISEKNKKKQNEKRR